MGTVESTPTSTGGRPRVGSQRGVELDEKTSLLSSDHYNAAHRMQVSPEKTPITAMSMDEVLERAAQLAEEAKAPARQESSVSQPTSCTDSDDMKEVRAAIQAGNAQHLLELCKQDPYRLRHRDMVFWRTPLHAAAAAGKIDCVLVLLKAGANVLDEDKYHDKPYDLAKRLRHPKVAAVLKDVMKRVRKRRHRKHSGDRSAGAQERKGVDGEAGTHTKKDKHHKHHHKGGKGKGKGMNGRKHHRRRKKKGASKTRPAEPLPSAKHPLHAISEAPREDLAEEEEDVVGAGIV